jgi:Pyridoxamine 5'-phosphate oxidase
VATTEPGVEDVEQAIGELLREEEIGSLAVVGPNGAPAVSMMHFASYGLVVYVHTFTNSRKHAAIQRDPRVSYTMAAIPPDGFSGRGKLRAIQVGGLATPSPRARRITRHSSGLIPSRPCGTTIACACCGENRHVHP